MVFNILYGEITTGGFLELIKNGFCNYIFQSIFSETLKRWGAIELAVIIDQARKYICLKKSSLKKRILPGTFLKCTTDIPNLIF
jgi:hypothetical protein